MYQLKINIEEKPGAVSVLMEGIGIATDAEVKMANRICDKLKEIYAETPGATLTGDYSRVDKMPRG